MKNHQKREPKKPRTAEDKGKRYRCAVCRKKSPKKTKAVPYYCDAHRPKEEAQKKKHKRLTQHKRVCVGSRPAMCADFSVGSG